MELSIEYDPNFGSMIEEELSSDWEQAAKSNVNDIAVERSAKIKVILQYLYFYPRESLKYVVYLCLFFNELAFWLSYDHFAQAFRDLLAQHCIQLRPGDDHQLLGILRSANCDVKKALDVANEFLEYKIHCTNGEKNVPIMYHHPCHLNAVFPSFTIHCSPAVYCPRNDYR